MVDTGSEVTIFVSRLCKKLKPVGKLKLDTGFAQKSARCFRQPDASIGDIHLTTRGFVVGSDLSFLRQVTGYEVYGMLGIDFLKRHRVRIDFDNGRFTFLTSVKSANGAFGKPIRLFYKPNLTPYVAGAASNDDLGFFIVDTGASSTAGLKVLLFDKLTKKGQSRLLGHGNLATGAGVIRGQQGRIPFLAVKTSRVQNPIVRPDTDNLLGLGFWSRFVVTFDFPDGLVYLKEGRRFKKQECYDLSGLHILRINGQTIVHSVDKDSPADKARITSKDIIREMDGEPATSMSLKYIREKLCMPNSTVRMTILRDSREISASLVLVELRSLR